MKTYFYSGAFDPFTLFDADIVFGVAGHTEDKVIIAIDLDDKKCPIFSVDAKKKMIEKSIQWISATSNSSLSERVKIIDFHGLPIYKAKEYGATHFVIPSKEKYDDTIKFELSKQIGKQLLDYSIDYYHPITVNSSKEIAEDFALLYRNKEYIMLASRVTPPVHNMLMQNLLKQEYGLSCRASGISWEDFCAKMLVRPYHNLSHIAYMINKYNLMSLYADKKRDLHSELMIKSAIFFHDYVQDDEEGSYRISKLSEKAKGLFMATKHGDALPDNLTDDEQLIHDLDLAIFADKILYKDYAYSIRKEYADVAQEEYVQARLKVLDALEAEISEKTLFSSEDKKQALLNIKKERGFWENGIWPDWL